MKRVCFMSYLIVAVTIISGCATQGTNISKNGKVTIDRTASEKVFIPWADAYQDGNDLLLTGVVKRKSFSAGPLKSHVDVTIFSAEGAILQEGYTKAIYVPGHRVGKGISWERFRIRLPAVLPQGAKIKMVVGQGEHAENLPG